ncbi:MAG: tetratricopeptide repeat protein [Brevinematia bacterium]
MNNLWKDSEYFFFQSYKVEKNQKALGYFLYLNLLNSKYEVVSKFYDNKKFELRGFGLYPSYWVKYLEGDINEALEILEKMAEEEHYFLRIFAIKELVKFGRINGEDLIKDRFKYFGLSYDFPLEEQRASLYLDYLSKRHHLSLIQAKSLLKDYPEIADVYLDYLEICFSVGSEDTIKEALSNEAIIEMAKKDFRIMFLLARQFFKMKELEKSKEYLMRLSNYFKHNPLIYYNLGNIHFITGKFTKAIELYERATELAPLLEKAFYNLGISYYRIGEINKAIKCFEKAISISLDPRAIYNISICLIEKKEYEDAYHFLNKIPKWYNSKYSPYFLKEKIKDVLFEASIS